MREEVNEKGKARTRHVNSSSLSELNVKIEVILFGFSKLWSETIHNLS